MLLAIGTMALLVLACIWGVIYIRQGMWLLLSFHIVNASLSLFVLYLIGRNQDRLAAIVLTHGLLVILHVFSMLDTPMLGATRSVHVYFLPMAAGSAFAFRKEGTYLRSVLPWLFLGGFLLYGPTNLGVTDPQWLPPPAVMTYKVWINYTIALILLGLALLVMQTDITIRNALYTDMRMALDKDQFLLYYQPQVNAQGDIFGAEALLRWQHPEQGMMAPGKFIGVAEETGMIHAIGAWVLQKACEDLVMWSRNPLTAHLVMSVNVSASQLRQPDFVSQVMDIVRRTGAPQGKLKLELTESIFATDVMTTSEKMEALRSFGICWALDDFGTGFSSLNYLKHLPFEQLKIDQSFVRDLQTSKSDKAIVQTLIGLSKKLNMTLIAEGVETTIQLDLLKKKGCLCYQGYLFSKPLPMDEFIQFITHFEHSAARAALDNCMVVPTRSQVPLSL